MVRVIVRIMREIDKYIGRRRRIRCNQWLWRWTIVRDNKVGSEGCDTLCRPRYQTLGFNRRIMKLKTARKTATAGWWRKQTDLTLPPSTLTPSPITPSLSSTPQALHPKLHYPALHLPIHSSLPQVTFHPWRHRSTPHLSHNPLHHHPSVFLCATPHSTCPYSPSSLSSPTTNFLSLPTFPLLHCISTFLHHHRALHLSLQPSLHHQSTIHLSISQEFSFPLSSPALNISLYYPIPLLPSRLPTLAL